MRNYGEWATNESASRAQNDQQVKEFATLRWRPVTDMNYRGFDLNYPDLDRTARISR